MSMLNEGYVHIGSQLVILGLMVDKAIRQVAKETVK